MLINAGMVVIIDAKEAAEATPKILSTHRIPHYKSSDLQHPEAEAETSPAQEQPAAPEEDNKKERVQEEEDEEDDFEEEEENPEVPITVHGHEIRMK